jgi:hypothetical protein
MHILWRLWCSGMWCHESGSFFQNSGTHLSNHMTWHPLQMQSLYSPHWKLKTIYSKFYPYTTEWARSEFFIISIKLTNVMSSTNSVELSTTREVTRYAITWQFPSILRNPKVHYCVHKGSPLVPILGQSTNQEAPHYAAFSTPPSLHRSSIEKFSSACCSQTPSVYAPLFMSENKFHTHIEPQAKL